MVSSDLYSGGLEVKIIILSASWLQSDYDAAFQVGAYACLPKNTTSYEIIKTIRAAEKWPMQTQDCGRHTSERFLGLTGQNFCSKIDTLLSSAGKIFMEQGWSRRGVSNHLAVRYFICRRHPSSLPATISRNRCRFGSYAHPSTKGGAFWKTAEVCKKLRPFHGHFFGRVTPNAVTEYLFRKAPVAGQSAQ
jgi:hypothetical protein